MFKLVRNFSLVSAVILIAGAVSLAAVYWDSAETALLQTAETQNVALARSIENTLGPRFASYLMQAAELDKPALQPPPDSRMTDEALKTHTVDTSILRINIYTIRGVRIFSSAPEVAGDELQHQPELLAGALLGKTTSTLTRGESIATSEGTLEERDLVKSYIPIRYGRLTVGVFEAYRDVGAAVEGMKSAAIKLGLLLLFVFGLLFAVLFPFIRRAQGTLEEQYARLRDSEKNIAFQKSTIGHEVAERALVETAAHESQSLLDYVSDAQSRPVDESDPGALFDPLLRDVLRFSGSEYGFIGEKREDEDGAAYLHILAMFDLAWEGDTRRFLEEHVPSGVRFHAFDGINERLVAGAEPIIEIDLSADRKAFPEGHPPLRTYLGIPLRWDRRVIGVLGLANRADGYTMELVERMAPLVSICASQVEGHRTWEEFRLTRESLAESEARKEAILKSAFDGVITFDDDGKVVEFNSSAEAMFGVRAEDAVGREMADIVVPPQARDDYRAELQRYLATGEGGERKEFPAMRSDGREFPVEMALTPVEFGHRRLFTAVLRDLGESRDAEKRIRRNLIYHEVIAAILDLSRGSAPLREILDQTLSRLASSPDLGLEDKGAIFLIDDKTGELEIKAENELPPTLLETCGRVAKSGKTVFVEAGDERHQTQFPDMPPHGYYCVPIRGDGDVLGVLNLYVAQEHRRDEEKDRFIATVAGALAIPILRDRMKRRFEERTALLDKELAELKLAEKQSRAAIKQVELTRDARSVILANASLDLRTPLNAIIGFSETILNRVFGDIGNPQYQRYIEYVHDSAKRLLDLIQEMLLDLSKIEAVKMEATPDDTESLANFAKFTTHSRIDQDMAEALFQRAIAADPGNSVILGNYAMFRTSIRNDHEKADELFQRAIETDPDNALHLGNYAVFLADIRKHHDQAEEYFKRAIAADPNHSANLGSYANFLTRTLENHDRADELYRRAIDIAPDNAGIIGDYALFLRNIRGDDERAEDFYRHAAEADPAAPLPRLAYATFLLFKGDVEKGSRLLDEAISRLTGEELLRGLFFRYAYEKSDDKRTEAFNSIRDLLKSRVFSPAFDPSQDLRRLAETGHTEPELLVTLAAVIAVREDPHALDRFPAWKTLETASPEQLAGKLLLDDSLDKVADDE